MFIHQSTLQILVPGEPSPEALHREEYFNEPKDDTADGDTSSEDHLAASRISLLRAQVTTRVGRYFV